VEKRDRRAEAGGSPDPRLREPFILPQPQDVEWTKKDFEVKAATKIAHSAEGLMPGVARDLAEHIRETYGLKLELADLAGEFRVNPDLHGCMPSEMLPIPPAMRLVVERENSASRRPRPAAGYVLIADPLRVIIAGSATTTFGGVLRHHEPYASPACGRAEPPPRARLPRPRLAQCALARHEVPSPTRFGCRAISSASSRPTP